MEVIIREIKTSLSAFDLYSLFKSEDVIFLDSAKDPERLGRYSFIGLNPFKKVTYSNGVVNEDGTISNGDPFVLLNRIMNRYKVKNPTQLPFVGGCMGYMSYDLGRDLETIPVEIEETVALPSLYFVFYENVIVIDHHCNRVYITELYRMSVGTTNLDEIEIKIGQGQPNPVGALNYIPVKSTAPFDQGAYMTAVERMRQYIRTGDIYIANMTQTYVALTERQGFDLYKILRHLNPAPFAAYLPLDGFEIICSSPERFIQVCKGKVTTRPIKGTRPRGSTLEEDEANKRALEESDKDKSELLMVVDLERNDLSKVCRPYTVKVTELFAIETYATVHHLVATVEGKLREDQTAVDCLKACFPGGSITGTPKIRAMEVIESLEATRRNVYTGCIGYFGFDGGADFNIVIRTILKKGHQTYIGVGGGITWESDAEEEYREILDKGEALFRALGTKEIRNATID